MIDVQEAKAGAKALYLLSATLAGLNVSPESPERLAGIVEQNFGRVDPNQRPLAVSALLKLIAAALESAQERNSDTLHETNVDAGRAKACPVFPFD
ncbi:MAG: hypothetical protein QM802_07170 [Agriterribacter sp.]